LKFINENFKSGLSLNALLLRQNIFPADQVEKVAFDAHITGSLGNLGRSQTIKYTIVNSNIGNMYNSATGVFTCDRSGVYVFFVRFLVAGKKSIYFSILKNGSLISPTYVYNPNALGQSYAMTITHLQHGDSVWVETADYQEQDLNGIVLDDHYNSFAGFLLYSD